MISPDEAGRPLASGDPQPPSPRPQPRPGRVRELARRRQRARRRRIHALVAAAVLALGFGFWSMLGNSEVTSGQSKRAPRAAAVPVAALRGVRVVPGHLAAPPWPVKGQGAVAVLGEGVMVSTAAEKAVPIASLTKMMTAYIVLKDHPLSPGEEGPTFVMSSADVAAYVHADQTDESNVPVALGEHLTEHQLLEALLIPSADNIADFLAGWDAGSLAAFVSKMNVTAAALGLHATHYADASGVNPQSRSDASDQALLAASLMQSPVVRGIVSKGHLRFPVAGTIWNYNPGLGTDGIIGVKSGFTSEAQGCLATAAYRSAAGAHPLVVAVVLGDPGGLGTAARADERLLDAAGRSLVGYRVPLPRGTVGSVVTGAGATPLSVVGDPPLLVGWPGLRLSERIVVRPTAAGATAGALLADLVFSSPEGVIGSVPLGRNVVTPTTASSGAGDSGVPTTSSSSPVGGPAASS